MFGFLLVILIFLMLGLWLLISPASYFAYLDRAAGVTFWSQRTESWNPRALRVRVVGLVITLMCLFLVVGMPVIYYFQHPEEVARHVRPHTAPPNMGAVAVLLFVFILGVALLAKPIVTLNAVSPRKFSAEEPEGRRAAYQLRIVGTIIIMVSLLGSWIEFVQYVHSRPGP